MHIYEDDNKRTAYLAAVEYLDRHDLEIAEKGEAAARVMRHRKRYSVEEIAEWMQTGEINEERLRER